MKLNIPELGTILILSSDWSFEFIPEGRNVKLGEYLFPDLTYMGPYSAISRYLFEDDDTKYNKELYIISDPVLIKLSHEIYKVQYNRSDDDKKKLDKYVKKAKVYYKEKPESFIYHTLSATIPVGSELKVDRIYIRKGLSDYSSVSFWVKFPDQKKRIRFFAKLHDVNNVLYNE